MRINDNEEGTVDMDMLEENLKVIQDCSCRNCIKQRIRGIFVKSRQTARHDIPLDNCIVVSDIFCGKTLIFSIFVETIHSHLRMGQASNSTMFKKSPSL